MLAVTSNSDTLTCDSNILHVTENRQCLYFSAEQAARQQADLC